jgi:hypothetical protein
VAVGRFSPCVRRSTGEGPALSSPRGAVVLHPIDRHVLRLQPDDQVVGGDEMEKMLAHAEACLKELDLARRAAIRTRTKGGQSGLAVTLNGSDPSIGRTMTALLEQHRQREGSVVVPGYAAAGKAGVPLR